jgi:hypothetical protein
MIGIIFALAYTFLFVPILKKVNNRFIKGVIFGLSLFVFAQIMMMVMGAIFGGMSSPEGSKMLVLLGGIIGHIIYGVVVSLLVKTE